MKKRFLLFLFFIAIYFGASAQSHIHVYFNHAVDISLSSGTNAVYCSGTLDDSMVAYINKATYSIDVAVYDYSPSGSMANIAAAVNNAYARGVKVRWIYDGSSSNSGLAALNSAIRTLGSPTTSAYTIMHNKFMVIDAKIPARATVWTGSLNWNNGQVNSDWNNVVVIQDGPLALNYVKEFNEMWGDTGLVPNNTLSKFGPYKTDNTTHSFTIDGHLVECYFSPSDRTNTFIKASLATANHDLLFGMYTFTDTSDANTIIDRINAGVKTYGIIDNFSSSYQPYTLLNPIMGAHLSVYSGSGVYHNKMAIVDAARPSSDPQVITGSHNWSASANTKNDENTLIIHDPSIANQYLQSFSQNFKALGGNFDLLAGVESPVVTANEWQHYPNPVENELHMHIDEISGSDNFIRVYDLSGRLIFENQNAFNADGDASIALDMLTAGSYFIYVHTSSADYSSLFIKR